MYHLFGSELIPYPLLTGMISGGIFLISPYVLVLDFSLCPLLVMTEKNHASTPICTPFLMCVLLGVSLPGVFVLSVGEKGASVPHSRIYIGI